MKKTIVTISAAIIIAATVLPGCKSSTEKEAAAQENVQEAKEDLKEVQQDANAEAVKAANAEEWREYKMEVEMKIQNNEIRIVELKEKIKKKGKVLDSIYETRINTLEEKNKEMRAKLNAYEKEQSDWQTFKTEFNRDMDELGQSLKDFTIDNKK